MEGKPDPSSVIKIPELLLNILKYLEGDTKSLLSALLVNRTWFECGVTIAWKNATLASLAAASEENRPIYASSIRHIGCNTSFQASLQAKVKDLEFTNLRSFSIETYRLLQDEDLYLEQYIRPTLESIHLYGSGLGSKFFTAVQLRCRRLRELTLDSPGHELTSEHFLEFLRGCSALSQLSLLYGIENIVSDDVVVHLASRDNLRTLSLGPVIDARLMERIVVDVSNPFQHTTDLRLSLTSTALHLITPHLSSLTVLELTVKDNEHSALEHVTSLLNLQRLTINYAMNTNLSSAELLSLKHLTNLEAITLNGMQHEMNTFNLDCFQFTDSEFETLLSSLPRLSRLNFGVQCMLTSTALKTVAKYCPRIDTLQILVPIETTILRPESVDQEPMLPELHTLDLVGFDRPADVSPDDEEV
ncbi:hypothetical protein LOZ53_006340 [Ophidiomyces ophidiicola]|nr:hypothetical protein LOZ55_002083 [Ophidiomyces ophidiicola]KAI1982080.1 hypothetical protein LOZ53_006340 [Ophidiomyces ophidiicola]KAI1985283.1 hypothetical protein LOZ54_004265 [Ophidiomyces ophidiicola]KAI1991076.1 hypothetical protein LOZ51_004606 [Ophidiomyces ophidiicola]